MRKKSRSNKKGSAMLIALVIMMVLTLLSMALMLVSFSLFSTVNKQQDVEQCTELARSLSKEIKEEITGPEFETYAEQSAASLRKKFPLWFYLRYNVLQSKWPYYDEDSDDRAHSSAENVRHFTLDTGTELKHMADQISVSMYWQSEAYAEQENAGYIDPEVWMDASVVVEVTCEKGKQKSTVSTTYVLVEEEESKEYTDAPEKSTDTEFGSEMNPDRNEINPKARWSWSVSEMQ